MTDTSVVVSGLTVRLFRAEARRALVTSFGELRERPSLIIEIEESDGARGWGEAWGNFPAYAAERRGLFIQDVVAPMLVGARIEEPGEAARMIDRAFGIQAIQAGEQGLLGAVIAALDQALWDLIARRSNLPLWQLLGGRSHLPVYASGVPSDDLQEHLARLEEDGHRARSRSASDSATTSTSPRSALREMRSVPGPRSSSTRTRPGRRAARSTWQTGWRRSTSAGWRSRSGRTSRCESGAKCVTVRRSRLPRARTSGTATGSPS
jgi:D-galactarolactone cycloisomerase